MTISQRRIFQESRRYHALPTTDWTRRKRLQPVYERYGERWYMLSDQQVAWACVLAVLILAIGGW